MPFAMRRWRVGLHDDFNRWLRYLASPKGYDSTLNHVLRVLGIGSTEVYRKKRGKTPVNSMPLTAERLEAIARFYGLPEWKVLWAIQRCELIAPPDPEAFTAPPAGRKPAGRSRPEIDP